FAHAVQDGGFPRTVLEEAHHPVQGVEGAAGRGKNDGEGALGHPFHEWPITQGAAGNLDPLEPMLFHLVYRYFIEGGADLLETPLPDPLHQDAERRLVQASLQESLDVLGLAALPAGRVDERVQVPVL